MTSLCVTGYGSLDYAVTLDGFAVGDRTTLINARDAAAWPRCGGCPAYVARAAIAASCDVHVVSWMGDNEEGRLYRDGLISDGVDASGIAYVAAARSPTALLVYQADGSCACLYDPALAGEERLTKQQRALIAEASHLCISVGPSHLIHPIVDALSVGTKVYWLTKNDSAAFTPENRRLLSRKADVVFCNRAERGLIAGDSDAVVIETQGSAGVVVASGDSEAAIEVEAIAATDTTGAGDTFAGAFIAAEMRGETDPVAAARQAAAAAGEFLRARSAGGRA